MKIRSEDESHSADSVSCIGNCGIEILNVHLKFKLCRCLDFFGGVFIQALLLRHNRSILKRNNAAYFSIRVGWGEESAKFRIARVDKAIDICDDTSRFLLFSTKGQ